MTLRTTNPQVGPLRKPLKLLAFHCFYPETTIANVESAFRKPLNNHCQCWPALLKTLTKHSQCLKLLCSPHGIIYRLGNQTIIANGQNQYFYHYQLLPLVQTIKLALKQLLKSLITGLVSMTTNNNLTFTIIKYSFAAVHHPKYLLDHNYSFSLSLIALSRQQVVIIAVDSDCQNFHLQQNICSPW